MSERPDLGEPQPVARDSQTKPGQFAGISISPNGRIEVIADLGTPTGIERIIIESTKADDATVAFLEHRPWSKAGLSPLAFVTGDVPPNCRQIGQSKRVLHRFGITKKPEQVSAMR